MIDHDIGEDVGGVEDFNPRRTDDSVATAPTSVPVLVAEDKMQSLGYDLCRDGLRNKRGSLDKGEDTFGGAIGDGPTIATLTEGPTSFAGKAMVAVGGRQFIDHLIFDKITATVFDLLTRR